MDRFNTPGTLATAKELVTLKFTSVALDALIPNMIEAAKHRFIIEIEAAKHQFIATDPNLMGALNEVAAQLRQEYEPKRAENLERVATIWATHFTEQELKDIIAFYKTPSGKKMLMHEPDMIEAGRAASQGLAAEFIELVQQRFRTEVQKKGYKL